MPVTDEQVAALRAYLANDREAFQRLWAELDPREGYAALLGYAFMAAVQQRFPWSEAALDDILDYVGDRRRYRPNVKALPPGVAERLMWYAVSGNHAAGIHLGVRYSVMLVILWELVAGDHIPEADVDALLAEARLRADKQYPGGMVGDDDLAGLRAMLTLNGASAGEILKRPGRSGTNQTFYMLMAAAFTTAVRMRFGTDATPATRPEVAEYIADVRKRSERANVSLSFDWTAAERLILEVLEDDDQDEDDINVKTRFAAYVTFIMVIVNDERLDELGIEAFMLLSRERADKWLAPDAMTVRFG